MKAFYYDIVCPYAYMAFSFLHRHDVFRKEEVALKPILLGGLFKLMEQPDNPNQFFPVAKSDYLKTDIKRQADYFGAPLSFHGRHPVSSLKAMRLLISCAQEMREALTARLYQAYWQENIDIDSDEVIEKIATEFNLSLENPASKTALIEATDEAFQRKIFGVPTLLVDDRLYFGADRLILLKERLHLELSDYPWTSGQKKIDFYFDFASPYSYLAFKEVVKSKASFNFMPVLLGAIFREHNVTHIPMLSAHPNKAAYYLEDMNDWAKYRGLEFKFNDHFPVRSVTANRVFLLEPRVGESIFDAAWSKNLDIGDEKVLISVLNHAGFDGEKLIENSQDQAIKDQLKTNTTEAVERGVFGVPTFLLGDHLVFGQDRFSWIKMHLAGKA
jgi:2-hydroxychromene-2-carboxylate isomerase